jgi:hypothetical protein
MTLVSSADCQEWMFYMEGREEAEEELRLFWRYRRLCAAAEKELGVVLGVGIHNPFRTTNRLGANRVLTFAVPMFVVDDPVLAWWDGARITFEL